MRCPRSIEEAQTKRFGIDKDCLLYGRLSLMRGLMNGDVHEDEGKKDSVNIFSSTELYYSSFVAELLFV